MSTDNQPTEARSPGSRRQVINDPRKEGRDEHGVAAAWRVAAIALACVLLAGGAYAAFGNSGPKEDYSALSTAKVRRDRLQVKVTEGGTLIARKSLEIKSKVDGRRTILEVIPEGTIITQQDVDQGMVLVRLDVSELEERLGSREISYYSAEAANTKAQEDYDIQVKQNESNTALAELNVKFARMELDRYVGAPVAERLLAPEGGLETVDLSALAEAEVRRSLLSDQEQTAQEAAGPAEPEVDGVLALGGEARQDIRRLSADVQLKGEEYSRAQFELQSSQTLFSKTYISANQLKSDELNEQRARVEQTAAEEALRLFLRYTLQKEVEKRLSDYLEAQRDLDRTLARATSQLAQARAERESRRASFNLEKQRLDDLRETLANAIIPAPRPGRVVYASTTNAWQRMRDPVREGKDVRQNETILIIPDLSTLAAQVNIHETDIEKVKEGQAAIVTVEAMPGRFFAGTVVSVSPVASAAHAWLNPDIKVYQTEVAIDAVPNGLTPGMSATAEIMVADLPDVLLVPIEAVSTYKGGHVCWVRTAGRPAMRRVECGHFTRTSVQILSGLQDGEEVYLEPPFGVTPPQDQEEPIESELTDVTAAIDEAGSPAETDTPQDEQAESPQDSAGRADRRRQGERPPGVGGRQGNGMPARTP